MEITREIWESYLPQPEEREPESRFSEQVVYQRYLQEARTKYAGTADLSEGERTEKAKEDAMYRMYQDQVSGEADRRRALRGLEDRHSDYLSYWRDEFHRPEGSPLPRGVEDELREQGMI